MQKKHSKNKEPSLSREDIAQIAIDILEKRYGNPNDSGSEAYRLHHRDKVGEVIDNPSPSKTAKELAKSFSLPKTQWEKLLNIVNGNAFSMSIGHNKAKDIIKYSDSIARQLSQNDKTAETVLYEEAIKLEKFIFEDDDKPFTHIETSYADRETARQIMGEIQEKLNPKYAKGKG